MENDNQISVSKLFQNLEIPAVLLDQRDRLLHWNPAFEKLIGFHGTEISEKPYVSYFANDNLAESKDQRTIIRSRGLLKQVSVMSVPVDAGRIELLYDLTRENHLRAESIRSAGILDGVFANSRSLLAEVDHQFRLIRCNRHLRESLNYDEERLLGLPLLSLFHPAMKGAAAKTIENAAESDGPIAIKSIFRSAHGGEPIHVTGQIQAIPGLAQRHYLLTLEDRSEERDLSIALRDKERFCTQMVSQSPLGILSLNSENLINGANASVCRMLGRSKEQVIGHTLQCIGLNAPLSRVCLEPTPVTYTQLDGVIRQLSIRVALFVDSSGTSKSTHLIIEDHTRLLELEMEVSKEQAFHHALEGLMSALTTEETGFEEALQLIFQIARIHCGAEETLLRFHGYNESDETFWSGASRGHAQAANFARSLGSAGLHGGKPQVFTCETTFATACVMQILPLATGQAGSLYCYYQSDIRDENMQRLEQLANFSGPVLSALIRLGGLISSHHQAASDP